jgi:hypothetical protein
MCRFISVLLGVAVVIGIVSQTFASPVQWPVSAGGNGHWYEAITADTPVRVSGTIVVNGVSLTGYSGGITWTEANAAATAKGGWLVDILSAAENAFVYNLVNPTQHPEFWFPEYGIPNYQVAMGPWLGGFQPAESPQPGGNWQWVTGKKFTDANGSSIQYTNWSSNQPGNSYQTTNIPEDALHFYNLGGTGKWNDCPSWTATNGYVVEYAVPPPSASEKPEVRMEVVPTSASDMEIRRLKVPDGWLVFTKWFVREAPGTPDHSEATCVFYPDPHHNWDVRSIPQRKPKPADSAATRTPHAKPAEAANKSATPRHDKEIELWKDNTWQMGINLDAPNLLPPAVQYAVIDKDPLIAFNAHVKRMHAYYRDRIEEAENDDLKQVHRTSGMTVAWDSGFRSVTGDRLYLLIAATFTSHSMSSNGPDGKKWVVTKTVQIKGKPVCWCLPVEVKNGKSISVTLTERNAFDLDAAYDKAMKEAGEAKK